ncbi:hypothetical protein HPP92_022913 [Vanilla planifolia]|uniref:Uncharacterized protein n=1 Tax=Vanilla planifolia TaxID=51239 RepID=A0A835UED5_VANPL|nr:hypothetical protein HPP92_023340 [Vanilla planifolia]KAG0459785.1 hypothetical protein HPP92_022913 [Vanilla planifolia]
MLLLYEADCLSAVGSSVEQVKSRFQPSSSVGIRWNAPIGCIPTHRRLTVLSQTWTTDAWQDERARGRSWRIESGKGRGMDNGRWRRIWRRLPLVEV